MRGASQGVPREKLELPGVPSCEREEGGAREPTGGRELRTCTAPLLGCSGLPAAAVTTLRCRRGCTRPGATAAAARRAARLDRGPLVSTRAEVVRVQAMFYNGGTCVSGQRQP